MKQHHAGQTQALSNLFLRGDASVCKNSAYHIQDEERDQKVCSDHFTSNYSHELHEERSPKPTNEVDKMKSKTKQNPQHINTNMELDPSTINHVNVKLKAASVRKKRKRDKGKTLSHDKTKRQKKNDQKMFESIDISSDEDITNLKDSGLTRVANLEQVNGDDLHYVSKDDNKHINTKTDSATCEAIIDVLSDEDITVDNRGLQESINGQDNNILFESESAVINSNNSHTELTIISDVETDESNLDKMLSGTFHTTTISGESHKPAELNAVTESLVGNQESISTDIVDITCPYCDSRKSLTSYKLLREHCRDKHHYATAPYRCPKCSYSNEYLSFLVEHMRTHTGEKPFSCHICSAKFSLKGNLKQHLKTHSQEKQYACYLCSFKCHQKGDLVKHLRYHTNERPFKCPMCDYTAILRSHLKDHIRTHTGEKPYECQHCKRQFSRKFSLGKHIRNAVCR